MNYKTLAIFFAGVGIGALGARLYLKEKYEKILDMEIDRVNDAYEKEMESIISEREEKEKAIEHANEEAKTLADRIQKETDKVYRHELAKQAYDSYFKKEEEPIRTVAPIENTEEPYVISGNDFITDTSHDKTTLVYYINAKLLCEDDEPLDVPAEEVLGDDFVSHFHDGEDGVVYVRNNKMGVDYEVILDESSEEFVRDTLGFSDK